MKRKPTEIDLADQLCNCSKQVILALNSGNMILFNKWISKQNELSNEIRDIAVNKLIIAEKEHEKLIKQVEIERVERNKRAEETIEQAKAYIQNYNYKHCLSVVR